MNWGQQVVSVSEYQMADENGKDEAQLGDEMKWICSSSDKYNANPIHCIHPIAS